MWRLYCCGGHTINAINTGQDTYDMQWSFSGDVLLTTDSARALQLLDLRYGTYLATVSLQSTESENSAISTS